MFFISEAAHRSVGRLSPVTLLARRGLALHLDDVFHYVRDNLFFAVALDCHRITLRDRDGSGCVDAAIHESLSLFPNFLLPLVPLLPFAFTRLPLVISKEVGPSTLCGLHNISYVRVKTFVG